jgi:hypothetical protein
VQRDAACARESARKVIGEKDVALAEAAVRER